MLARPNNGRSLSASGHRRPLYSGLTNGNHSNTQNSNGNTPTTGNGTSNAVNTYAAGSGAAYSKHRDIVNILSRRPNSAFGATSANQNIRNKRIRPVTPTENYNIRRERPKSGTGLGNQKDALGTVISTAVDYRKYLEQRRLGNSNSNSNNHGHANIHHSHPSGFSVTGSNIGGGGGMNNRNHDDNHHSNRGNSGRMTTGTNGHPIPQIHHAGNFAASSLRYQKASFGSSGNGSSNRPGTAPHHNSDRDGNSSRTPELRELVDHNRRNMKHQRGVSAGSYRSSSHPNLNALSNNANDFQQQGLTRSNSAGGNGNNSSSSNQRPITPSGANPYTVMLPSAVPNSVVDRVSHIAQEANNLLIKAQQQKAASQSGSTSPSPNSISNSSSNGGQQLHGKNGIVGLVSHQIHHHVHHHERGPDDGDSTPATAGQQVQEGGSSSSSSSTGNVNNNNQKLDSLFSTTVGGDNNSQLSLGLYPSSPNKTTGSSGNINGGGGTPNVLTSKGLNGSASDGALHTYKTLAAALDTTTTGASKSKSPIDGANEPTVNTKESITSRSRESDPGHTTTNVTNPTEDTRLPPANLNQLQQEKRPGTAPNAVGGVKNRLATLKGADLKENESWHAEDDQRGATATKTAVSHAAIGGGNNSATSSSSSNANQGNQGSGSNQQANSSSSSGQQNQNGQQTTPPIHDYIIGKQIGQGAYATVRLAVHKPSSKKVAIKIYEKSRLLDPQRRKSVRREIRVMDRLSHSNIVKFYEVSDTSRQVFLVLEYINGGSLHYLLKKRPNRRLPEPEARMVFHQVCSALKYCHERLVVHRDIKLENVLVQYYDRASMASSHTTGLDPRTTVVKLIDFGFASLVQPGKPLRVFCGTPSYMAPEIIRRQEYKGFCVDIWALGILLYAMLFGCFPFRGQTDKELYKKILKGAYIIPEQMEDSVTRGAKGMLGKIFVLNMETRPIIQDIMADSWLEEHRRSSHYQQGHHHEDGGHGSGHSRRPSSHATRDRSDSHASSSGTYRDRSHSGNSGTSSNSHSHHPNTLDLNATFPQQNETRNYGHHHRPTHHTIEDKDDLTNVDRGTAEALLHRTEARIEALNPRRSTTAGNVGLGGLGDLGPNDTFNNTHMEIMGGGDDDDDDVIGTRSNSKKDGNKNSSSSSSNNGGGNGNGGGPLNLTITGTASHGGNGSSSSNSTLPFKN